MLSTRNRSKKLVGELQSESLCLGELGKMKSVDLLAEKGASSDPQDAPPLHSRLQSMLDFVCANIKV